MLWAESEIGLLWSQHQPPWSLTEASKLQPHHQPLFYYKADVKMADWVASE